VDASLSGSFGIATATSNDSAKPVARKTFDVEIVPREKWAELDIIMSKITPMGSNNPIKITVHHTAEERDNAKVSDAEHMRDIDRYHQKERGWACIGYHFVISPNGTIFQGRPVKYQGAHVSKHNPLNVGVALMGNFETSKPSNAQVASLKRLIKGLQLYFNIPKQNLYGHRDLGDTLCPGKELYKIIQQIKNSY